MGQADDTLGSSCTSSDLKARARPSTPGCQQAPPTKAAFTGRGARGGATETCGGFK